MTSLLRKGTHNVNVDTVKLAHLQCKLVERSSSVVVDLGMMTGSADVTQAVIPQLVP